MDPGGEGGSRDMSPKRRRSSVSGDSKTTNKLKEIAAEAKEKGFYPVQRDQLKLGKPPTRQTSAFNDKIPEGKTARNLRPLDVLDHFATNTVDLWQSIATATNEKIRQKIELKQRPTYGATVTAGEIRMVFLLRLKMTMLQGTSLEETYKDLELDKHMQQGRFNFICSNATLDPDELCAAIR